jgi:hypothetical protein
MPVFPWKRNFAKIPPAIRASLDGIGDKLVVVAATKQIKRADISAGIYDHVGLHLDESGALTVRPLSQPTPAAGKWSERNAFGWEIIRKDLPMTTKSFSFEAPNFGDASRNGTSMRVIQRDVYQRQIFEPRGMVIETELLAEKGDVFVVKFSLNDMLDRNRPHFELMLLWSINILQENVGVAAVFASDASREDYLGSTVLAWEIFPPGTIEDVIKRITKSKPNPANAPDFDGHIRERVALFAKLKPLSYLRGQGGFGSYFGAQFADDLVVFENLRYGNAVYVLYENWEEISKRSRHDLLNDTDAKFDRLPHVTDWQERLQTLIRFQMTKRRRRGGRLL